MATTQSRRKRKVGQYVRELRKRAGRTAEDAADLLGVKPPTITRFETGHTLCRRTELQALCVYFGATDQERAEALTLWEDAKQDNTRVVIPGSASRQLRAYLRAEAEAATAKMICPTVVNALLQTADYTAAIDQAPSGYRVSDSETERRVGAMISRQGRLRDPSPLNVHAILDEGVIRRMVGGPTVMRAQLERLLVLADLPYVTLQVVPFAAGAYGTMSGESVILEFPDPQDPAAAYVEYVGGGVWVEDDGDVRKLQATFDAVSEAALTPAVTASLIHQRLNELEE
jgi:transcriptional regulator with XRE-family HTH domain